MQPGKTGEVLISPLMHEGMDGPHLFEVTLDTDSPVKPTYQLYLRANWVKG